MDLDAMFGHLRTNSWLHPCSNPATGFQNTKPQKIKNLKNNCQKIFKKIQHFLEIEKINSTNSLGRL